MNINLHYFIFYHRYCWKKRQHPPGRQVVGNVTTYKRVYNSGTNTAPPIQVPVDVEATNRQGTPTGPDVRASNTQGTPAEPDVRASNTQTLCTNYGLGVEVQAKEMEGTNEAGGDVAGLPFNPHETTTYHPSSVAEKSNAKSRGEDNHNHSVETMRRLD